MRYLIPFLLCLAPSFLWAECDVANNYELHLIYMGEQGANPSSTYKWQLTVYFPDYSYVRTVIGYTPSGWVESGPGIQIFNYIPQSVFDSDPQLWNWYNAYNSGELVAALQAGYGNNVTPNQPILYTDFSSDHNFAFCVAPGPEPSIDSAEIVDYLKYLSMLVGVIVICQGFGFGFIVWDCVLRAKNNPKFWTVLFMLCVPSVASAQGVACPRVSAYTSHTITVNQTPNGYSSIRLQVFYDDGYPPIDGMYSGNGFYGYTLSGSFGTTGIPWDVILSDGQLKKLKGYIGAPSLLAKLGTPGATIDLYEAPDGTFSRCECTLDPSYGGCPEYTPSGPDVPTYCPDGVTEDTDSDSDQCGCPGQNYPACDEGGCATLGGDSDEDGCCNDLDPKPDDSGCGCDRAGPEGDCDGDCPKCEKLLTDFAEDFRVLFSDYGVDLSPFLDRTPLSTGLNIHIPSPGGPFSYIFSGWTGWSFGSDEGFMEPGPVKTVLEGLRLLLRSVLILICLFIFTRSILRVFLY